MSIKEERKMKQYVTESDIKRDIADFFDYFKKNTKDDFIRILEVLKEELSFRLYCPSNSIIEVYFMENYLI
jgi:hypothetical protein